jgi:hypothetical protein
MAEKRHPGITMHKLSFGGGFIGLLFAAGSALIFVLGFPTLWYFVALAFALGIGIAVLLRVVSKSRSERNKPLSILAFSETTETRKRGDRVRWRKSFKIDYRVIPALMR